MPPLPSSGPDPEWASISAELRTKLPGETIEIDSKRIRIEAVIAQLDIGNVVRHLTITAKTPAGEEIVRYELAQLETSTLASSLAATLSQARVRKTPADEVVKAISSCLPRGGSHLMRKIIAETNPFIQLSMERSVPNFEQFAQNPLSMDMTFTLERTIGNSQVRAVATLLPERYYTVVQAFTYPLGDVSLPPSHAFKVRCPEHFLQDHHTPEEIVATLHKATWEAMDTIRKKGAVSAAALFRDPHVDDRLERGEIEPANCHTYHVLPSGARIMVEEGDAVACIRIESSATEESSTAFWRITSPLGLLLPDNPRVITANSAVESLSEGDPRQRLEAIRTLDRMSNADNDKLSPEGRKVLPFSIAPIKLSLGEDLANFLSELSRSKAKPLKLNTEFAILDLLDGFQSVCLTHRDSTYHETRPQDPYYIAFGVRNDGALKIVIRNSLRNHLDVLVSPRYFETGESREDCVKRLARLFNLQTEASLTELRAQLEKLEPHSLREVIASRALRPSESRFPSTRNDSLNDAFTTAAEVAQVYCKASKFASISDAQVVISTEGMCELVLTNTRNNLPMRMALKVVEDGILGITVTTGGDVPPQTCTFNFLTPISLPEGQEVMSTLFRLFQERLQKESSSPRGLIASLSDSPLFRYLQECQDRFAIETS
jgi:hypothetical protein